MFVRVVVVRAVRGLEGAGDEEEEGHEEGAGEEGGAAAETVEIEDCGEGHEDVEDVLDGGGEEGAGDGGAFHDVDYVVHPGWVG